MKQTVKLFAQAKDLAGSESIEIQTEEQTTVARFRELLSEQYPSLQAIVPHLLIAIDMNYVSDDFLINPESEIACFPPVSGG